MQCSEPAERFHSSPAIADLIQCPKLCAPYPKTLLGWKFTTRLWAFDPAKNLPVLKDVIAISQYFRNHGYRAVDGMEIYYSDKAIGKRIELKDGNKLQIDRVTIVIKAKR